MKKINIDGRLVGEGEPTYFIAEIGSNFDGSMERAKLLVDLAVEARADAVKFQSFLADKIVCGKGFLEKSDFQTRWDKPVEQVYKESEFPREWFGEVFNYCKEKNITCFFAPYDIEAVDMLEKFDMPAYKIGSGDITFLSLVEHIAKKGKPIILGVGASTLGEIEEAVNLIRSTGNENLILLQCITNYPSPIEEANIRAMQTIQDAFQTLVGYSDHTSGSTVPMGAVALGGCVIEKHFTDDKTRPGPDHSYAMESQEYKKMVQEIRLLGKALGSPIKDVAPCEKQTVVLQRRGLVFTGNFDAGTVIKEEMMDILRPAIGLPPKCFDIIKGRILRKDVQKGDPIGWDSF